MKTTSFIPCISLIQLVVGLSLLGIYESYKVSYINDNPNIRTIVTHDVEDPARDQTLNLTLRALATPVDWLFYLSTFTNVFCLFFCLAGILNALREIVLGYFIFSTIEVTVSFHFFVDVWTDARIRTWSQGELRGFEKAAIAFMFFNFLLSLCATFMAMRSLQDIKHKQKEEYNRLSVISDNLQFESDNDRL